ncbi:ABC transporter permease [Paenibacillus eucommiae]|uniref:Aldouronate transport system permease protein n=1 Tax=Paenibacillus eucommiae TaxID=1355755 RepID=A0ABS4J201_9BACL|nr:ABC transporter permease subunit [Paenibacillus eucommiae]MBP1993808.1 putative aldouronate transport system permease protein [Paenibacillus eucommiae]
MMSKTGFWKRLSGQKILQCFVLLGMLYLVIFSFIPMFGIIIAFKDYKISSGVSGFITSPWVGLKWFSEFVHDYKFKDLIRNTLMISFLKILFTFPAPILFAILLNEVKNQVVKRIIQTTSYLPHFISWVVVSGILFTFLSTSGGVINNLLLSLQVISKPLPFLYDPNYFWGLAVISDMWKDMGWWAIIFLAAIAGIDPSLYEAAQIDGAGRIARIMHVTIPAIKGAIIIVLILSVGGLLGGGMSNSNFEQSYLLGNALNSERAEIVQTYILKAGLAEGRFAYAAAVDLIQSVLSIVLLFGSNYAAKRISGTSLF